LIQLIQLVNKTVNNRALRPPHRPVGGAIFGAYGGFYDLFIHGIEACKREGGVCFAEPTEAYSICVCSW
jgi:hypothetical protein